MCLAIPGRVTEIFTQEGMTMARVQFGGVVRQACLDFVPEAVVGDYVIVHVGFAISRVDREEAEQTYELLQQMGLLEGELVSEFEEENLPGDFPAAGREAKSRVQ